MIGPHAPPGVASRTESLFFTLDRVEFAVRSLSVRVGFNTYLRNFYYNTSLDWFRSPTATNCFVDSFELVNATDLMMMVRYDSSVSLRTRVTSSYVCNITFSTDIFQCQLMTNLTFNFSAAVLVTGTPKLVSPMAMMLTGLSSSVLSILSSGDAILQQSRSDSLGELASCQFSLVDRMSPMDNPLQLGFGSELQFYHRGAVVGNISLLALFFFAVPLVVALVALCNRKTITITAATAVMDVSNSAATAAAVNEEEVEMMKAFVWAGDADEATVVEMSLGYSSLLFQQHQSDSISDLLVRKELDCPAKPHDTIDDDDADLSESPPALVQHDATSSDCVVHEAVGSCQETYLHAFRRLLLRNIGFPSIAAVPAVVLLDGTVHASVSLVVHPIDDHDLFLGTVGLAAYGLFFLTLAVVTVGYVKRKRKVVRLHKSNCFTARHSVVVRLRWLLLPTYVYVPVFLRHRTFHKMLKHVMDGSAFAPFIVYDIALSLVTSCLVGVGISERKLCFRFAVVLCCSHVAFLGSVLYIRPNASRLGLVINICNSGIGSLTALLTVFSMAYGLPGLGIASQGLALLMLVVNLASVMLLAADIVAAASWVSRKLSAREHGSTRMRKKREIVVGNAAQDFAREAGATSSDDHSDGSNSSLELKTPVDERRLEKYTSLRHHQERAAALQQAEIVMQQVFNDTLTEIEGDVQEFLHEFQFFKSELELARQRMEGTLNYLTAARGFVAESDVFSQLCATELRSTSASQQLLELLDGVSKDRSAWCAQDLQL